MLIFVHVDLNTLPTEQQMSYLKILVATCQANKIDGIVLEQNPNGHSEHLGYVRNQSDLIVISNSPNLTTAAEIN